MVVKNRELRRREKDAFKKLKGDKAFLEKIVLDMQQNGGELAPLLHWQLVEKSEDEIKNHTQMAEAEIGERYAAAFETWYAQADSMLDAWIGCTGLKPLEEEQKQKFAPLLDKINFLDLKRELDADEEWLNSDLQTLAEVNILSLFTPDSGDKPWYFLEVGGGYGRLAEAVLHIFENVKYVMVDAVPGSLMFAYLYLKYKFPSLKIGCYYADDPFDMEQFDCYICPAWHFEKLNSYQYDFSINIESLQEMGQFHVDYYLQLFDKVTRDKGIVYLSNAHDYVFKGSWNYPARWERKFIGNLPSAWSPNHPTEIFVKQKEVGVFEKTNALYAAMYEGAAVAAQLKQRKAEEAQKEAAEKQREWAEEYQKMCGYSQYYKELYEKAVAESAEGCKAGWRKKKKV